MSLRVLVILFLNLTYKAVKNAIDKYTVCGANRQSLRSLRLSTHIEHLKPCSKVICCGPTWAYFVTLHRETRNRVFEYYFFNDFRTEVCVF
jgi:hypothetical protein